MVESTSKKKNADAHALLEAARKRVSKNTKEDWEWLIESLADKKKKYFVAQVFKYQPIPRKLFAPMIRAAIIDSDASRNRVFIEPCMETFGQNKVLAALNGYISNGSEIERKGAKMALYWANMKAENRRCYPISEPDRENYAGLRKVQCWREG